MRWRWLLIGLLAVSCSLEPAFADTPVCPGEANLRVAEFPTEPTAVTVDVVELPSTQVANDVAATQLQVDAANTTAWSFDLSSVSGYPTDFTAKSYLVRFVPDAANCAQGQSPELCATEVVHVGGPACIATEHFGSPSTVHATSVVSAQGITQKVLTWHTRQGRLPIRWIEIPIAADRDFSSPDGTIWLVHFYVDANDTPRLNCIVPTTSDPSVSLPSSAHCAGG